MLQVNKWLSGVDLPGVQGVGEAIFVPSGWHHTVENVEDTLSINHNWINGHNLHWGWDLLRRERADAAAAIEDCRRGPCLQPCMLSGCVWVQQSAHPGLAPTHKQVYGPFDRD